MKIGLYFGSFNPIHIGHMAIANYMVEYTDIDQVWFVVSPHNPLKNKSSLLNNYDRLELVRRAIDDDERFKHCDIEFSLPQPSYTVDTLTYLKEKYPNQDFELIMGSDNLKSIHKWKNSDFLLENYSLLVYPRPNIDVKQWIGHPRIRLTDSPSFDISASFIRKGIKDGKNLSHFVPEKAWKYMEASGFYK
jgi:nicotinate-nucleotide adenylyltransferase